MTGFGIEIARRPDDRIMTDVDASFMLRLARTRQSVEVYRAEDALPAYEDPRNLGVVELPGTYYSDLGSFVTPEALEKAREKVRADNPEMELGRHTITAAMLQEARRIQRIGDTTVVRQVLLSVDRNHRVNVSVGW